MFSSELFSRLLLNDSPYNPFMRLLSNKYSVVSETDLDINEMIKKLCESERKIPHLYIQEFKVPPQIFIIKLQIYYTQTFTKNSLEQYKILYTNT